MKKEFETMEMTHWGFDPPESSFDDWLDGRGLRKAVCEVVAERLAGSGLTEAQLAQRLQAKGIYVTEGGVRSWLKGTPPPADVFFAIVTLSDMGDAILVNRLLDT